jgi:four helix bundle protein
MENGKLKMKENAVVDKSFAFAVRVVRLYKHLCDEKREFVLSKQLLRCGTSIGANISEAQQGQSKKDFLMKMNISLKECSETKYWLRLLTATDYLNENESRSIMFDCVELEKLLTSIVKTSAQEI